MKKTILSLLIACMATAGHAQDHMHISSLWYGYNGIPISEIDSITYGELSHQDKLPALIASDPNLSLFNEALLLTHMDDSLVAYINYDWYIEPGKPTWWGRNPVLTLSYYKFTAFVEPNEVYARYGIHTIDDLKAYAAKVYDEVYPEDAAITDPTDRRNSLNRFVSYHFIDRYATTANLVALNTEVYRNYDREAVDIASWYETLMPHSILRCSAPLLTEGEEQLYINRRGIQDRADERGVFVKGARITHSASTKNGVYHYIDDIIAYDKATQDVALNQQIILTTTTLTPELMNGEPQKEAFDGNTISYKITPEMEMEDIRFSGLEEIWYSYAPGFWSLDNDELVIEHRGGEVAISFDIPAVPAGEYELCLGCVITFGGGDRKIHFTFNGEACGDSLLITQPMDLGWKNDAELGSEQAIAENDSLLYTFRWRKGLDYFYPDDEEKYKEYRMRDLQCTGRYVVTRFTSDGKSGNRLDVTMHSNSGFQFGIDFIELCPTEIYEKK